MPRTCAVDLRWNALLNDFRRRGPTQAEFCRLREISLRSFRNCLYQPRPTKPAPKDDHSAARADNDFLPVTVLPNPIPMAAASQPRLELVLSNERRIAVTPAFDPQTLRSLIAIVENEGIATPPVCCPNVYAGLP
jgi:hypothetical protein